MKKSDDIELKKCIDLMDEDFCDTALNNNFCSDMFYWNGKSIANDWCKKKCKNC